MANSPKIAGKQTRTPPKEAKKIDAKTLEALEAEMKAVLGR